MILERSILAQRVVAHLSSARSASAKLRRRLAQVIDPNASRANASISLAVLQAAQFCSRARNARSKPEILQDLVDTIADTLSAERVALYEFDDASNLHVRYGNVPAVVELSHVKGIAPEGALAAITSVGGFIYVPSILRPTSYYHLDRNGLYAKRRGNILNPTITQTYIGKFGRQFSRSGQDMSMLFGAMPNGAFRADSFGAGRSILPRGMHPHDLLNIAAIVSHFAAEALAEHDGQIAVKANEYAAIAQAGLAERLLQELAHDAKTPVTTASGFMQIVHGNLPKDDSGREHLEIALRALDRMNLQINRIYLAVQKAPSRLEVPMNQKPTKIRKTIITENLLGRTHIEIAANVPREVNTDALVLEKVINGIIGNALKYGHPDDLPIFISCAKKTKDDMPVLEIEITDQGQGILPEHTKSIFTRKLQLDKTSSGDGWGLAIYRELIEKLGGELWATSEELGKGSTFHIRLPLFSPSELLAAVSTVKTPPTP